MSINLKSMGKGSYGGSPCLSFKELAQLLGCTEGELIPLLTNYKLSPAIKSRCTTAASNTWYNKKDIAAWLKTIPREVKQKYFTKLKLKPEETPNV